MALDYFALLTLFSQLKDTDLTDRESVYQELIDAEASAMFGAQAHERIGERTTSRNGSRPPL